MNCTSKLLLGSCKSILDSLEDSSVEPGLTPGLLLQQKGTKCRCFENVEAFWEILNLGLCLKAELGLKKAEREKGR